ncbi:MAG TPA: hypothetical protein VNW29_06875 [Candidatus Sulfotelmatobacter sp.]|jgi:hypothetical protein|nr:hypothetical protein [Candidatus Sulfotelmatobacter sp.]
MGYNTQQYQSQIASDTDKQNQAAVPYTPPPQPNGTSQKKFRTPLMNGMIAAFVILLSGLMLYNYAGHSLTQLAGISSERAVLPSPTATPTIPVSPLPTPSPISSPSPTQ